MSNIYIQEPATDGKVLLRTTVGDIDVELWSREAPKACRNFIQLCLEGYYDNTIFHRLVKDFIIQGGDPTGDGMGGESIYGEPFKDEFHSRLRFVRRGLVAMANSGKDDNGSQFFFTLGSTPELQNKHTIFGKVGGNTIYNMIKLGESDVDMNERPLFPYKIISTEILSNPFDDIIPRESKNKKVVKKEEKIRVKGSKNFSLLSFGDEAEEEEQEVTLASKEFQGKSKSSHDLLKNDPKLSSVPAVDETELNKRDHDYKNDTDLLEASKREKSDAKRNRSRDNSFSNNSENALMTEDDELYENTEAKCPLMDKLCKVKDEFKRLKRQLLCELKKRCEKTEVKKVHENPHVAEFFEESEKYKTNCSQLPKRGVSREELALSLLAKFKNRLLSTKERQISVVEDEDTPVTEKDDLWLSHELKCQKDEDKPILAKDANMRDGSDWYDIYDPRNPINKRRREPLIAECSFKKKRIN